MSTVPGSLVGPGSGAPGVEARTVPTWAAPLLVATFLPFVWRAVHYATLGSWLPVGVLLATGAAVGAGAAGGGRWWRRAVRGWGALLVLWGVARLVLLVLFVAADLSEAHLRAQLNPVFMGVSVAYLAAGVLLWRRGGAVGQNTRTSAAHSPMLG